MGLKLASFSIFHNIKSVVGVIFLGLLIWMPFFTSCKPEKILLKEQVITRYIDSTIWHTDTTYYQVPLEVYSDFTGLLDTLRLENTYSYTWSAVDTNKMILIGELRNKNVKVPVEYKWKERIIYQDTIIESVKEIQVPVEKVVVKTKYSWWSWICLTWTIITLISIGYTIYRQLRP